eukprot:CAMPEP_0179189732 /NCGR_PEP_ID=MMETSP0796-20121207/94192_1 /TAXON_ID=73915 /ORGANISM="Pyrodinium bahamense, Strain pbaha01" /LENGTH=157 /DNA_ID=CAMNT_0020893873 /DNA_START=172 /DNA_END=646 /DNA_ORIENTATION=+
MVLSATRFYFVLARNVVVAGLVVNVVSGVVVVVVGSGAAGDLRLRLKKKLFSSVSSSSLVRNDSAPPLRKSLTDTREPEWKRGSTTTKQLRGVCHPPSPHAESVEVCKGQVWAIAGIPDDQSSVRPRRYQARIAAVQPRLHWLGAVPLVPHRLIFKA